MVSFQGCEKPSIYNQVINSKENGLGDQAREQGRDRTQVDVIL